MCVYKKTTPAVETDGAPCGCLQSRNEQRWLLYGFLQSGFSGSAGYEHPPLMGLHELIVQGFLSSHLAPNPLHVPLLSHTLFSVHGLPSSHGESSGYTGLLHVPVFSHLSYVHGLPSSQSLVLPTHLPLEHRSNSVQALPSVQGLFGTGTYSQPVEGLQLSAVHALLSSQYEMIPAHLPT